MIIKKIYSVISERGIESFFSMQAEKLYKIQKEKEELVYIISHDFNAPLRHIKEFSKLLVNKSRNKFDAEELKYIEIIEKQVNTAENMLKGVLQLSRLNTQAQPFSHVDCEKLVSSIDTSAHVTLTYGKLPVIYGDEKQLLILFNQLIGNSIKFRSEERKLEIDITSLEEGENHRFVVKDNGIGIDPGFKDIIFTLFRMLDANNDYPGSGVGLTLCKQIVERHEGEIWLDTSSDIGASFHFTLPRNPKY